MKLKDYRETYYEFSGRTSDIARNLAFAGIALIWVFRVEVGSASVVPPDLILPALMFTLALAADLMHYVLATLIWGTYHRYLEIRRGVECEESLTAPRFMTWPQNAFFVLKIVLVVMGYIALSSHLWGLFVARS